MRTNMLPFKHFAPCLPPRQICLKSGYLAVFPANLLIFVRNGKQGAKRKKDIKISKKTRTQKI